ncbi:MAG: mechanosensitive ion channel family protein [Treponema sp.]|jgi:small-conductance mechanosensitive channel|nr:mechanosensitive ion channel family protein [Treponema sp.]
MTSFPRFSKAILFLFFIISVLFSPVLLPAAGDDEVPAGGSGGVSAEETGAAPVSPESPVVPLPGVPDGEARADIPAAPVFSDQSVVTAIEDTAGDLHTRITVESEVVLDYARRVGLALIVIAIQVLLIWLVWRLFDRFKIKLAAWGGKRLKPLVVKQLHILTTKQMMNMLLFGLKIVKYIVTAFQLFITIPIVFSLFPVTKNLASTLFKYILTPLKNILINAVKYTPNLISIVIILLITRYVIRGLKFFATQIERERLVIPGFYSDWAQPTFNLLRVLLYAFTMTVVYPYLPGSGSPIFQGVTVFVGLIFSLGSTSAIGNLIAGFVITYMRPFKIGDRIQIKETTGFVVEKTLMVVRLKTHKNEYVTFPNMMILSSSIINYHTSSDEDEEGLILYAEVSIGYAVPWTTVHGILIAAALKTNFVLDTPKPFVLQTALDDFYARYQINAYTKEVDRVPAIYSGLYQNLQDGFNAAGIDITSPSYQVRIQAGTPVKLPNAEVAVKLPVI